MTLHISSNTLHQLGWNDHFERIAKEQGINTAQAARVLSAQRDQFLVANGHSEWFCTPSGKMRHQRQQGYPVTGDWVVVESNVIKQVIARKNTLCRGGAGTRGRHVSEARHEQPIAANIDTVFIVSGLDRDYNLRRIERYLTLVYNCGMVPVVVLTKADLHGSLNTFIDEVTSVAFGVPIVTTSAINGCGIDELSGYLTSGQTVAMLGSSGVGKSTLANRLYGSDILATSAVSKSDGKGRHTTTSRELIVMPHGGLLMDNPGIREIAFSKSGDGLEATFADIQSLAKSCRFANCSHRHEPDCAVRNAVDSGDLPQKRLDNYLKMQRELEYVQARSQKSADCIEKERWRDVAMEIKRINKRKKR